MHPKKISKATQVPNEKPDHFELIVIYSTLHPKNKKKKTVYTFFSSAHGMFSRIDHLVGHKTILKKFKKIQMISMSIPSFLITTL